MKPRHDFSKFKRGTDFTNIKVNIDRSPTELALIKCYQCMYDDHKSAYICKNTICPLYPIKDKYMRKPHVLSEEVAEKARNNIKNYLNKIKNTSE